MSKTDNPCEGMKTGFDSHEALKNTACVIDGIIEAQEQAGSNVTEGYIGSLPTNATPINVPYFQKQMCAVNVHWHLGTEHYSMGEYDENGLGPNADDYAGKSEDYDSGRRLGSNPIYLGFRCHKYDENDAMFTKEYDWHHCSDMHVGETYEVHWPHSTLGACQTPFQFQSPFYDGVFCGAPPELIGLVVNGTVKPWENIGVQAQIFTIVNDETYFNPDLMRHAIVDEEHDHWKDVAYYTGSTTGTSRNNKVCSGYAPITWQVDRKCHLISASSFDKMCADMKAQHDDMSSDTHAHGARPLVWQNLTANNHQRRM